MLLWISGIWAACLFILILFPRYCTPMYLLWYLRMQLAGTCLLKGSGEKKHDTPRVVVSLTTIPSRLNRIWPCLNSILCQTRPPDLICLIIPMVSSRESQPYDIPEELVRDPRLLVHRCQQDRGPILKLYETLKLETDLDTLIVTVDDDTIYPRHLIRVLMDNHKNLQGVALGFRGWCLPSSGKFLKRRILYGNSVSSPQKVDVLSGISMVMYQRGLFQDDFFIRNRLPKAAFFVDDICISGYLAQKGVEKYLLPYPMREPFSSYLDTSRSNPLWMINQDGKNDQEMIDYYFYPEKGKSC